jgi:hypothetical protein
MDSDPIVEIVEARRRWYQKNRAHPTKVYVTPQLASELDATLLAKSGSLRSPTHVMGMRIVVDDSTPIRAHSWEVRAECGR